MTSFKVAGGFLANLDMKLLAFSPAINANIATSSEGAAYLVHFDGESFDIFT